MTKTSQHLGFERLADLAEGRLPDEERDQWLIHLAACAGCAAQGARLAELLRVMRADRSEDAPRDLIYHAVKLFGQRALAKPSVVRRVLAALSYDSRDLSPAMGVRSGQPRTRQLLYQAGENDLDLRIRPEGEGWVVSGQVLGQCEGGRIELAGRGGEARAWLNEMCEFRLGAVPAGSYRLRLHLSEREIEISELELKA